MDRKYVMKAERAASLSAFADYYGMTAYEEKLNRYFEEKDIHPGQEIVLCGYIGLAGTVYLAEEKVDDLEKTLPRHFIRSGTELKDKTGIFPDPQTALQHGVKAMYLIGEGGLLNGLCRLASDSATGFRIDYEEVPVKQVTIECCEVFDLNPWQLMSGGCVMMVTEHGYETVRAFEHLGVPCRIIGYISSDKDKVICHGEIRSCLNRPQPDELLKVYVEKNM
ncbi:MAG: AIR synthase-related protein [Lachnospiraceae bacterium]|nr:AIR synthase-related protein [Lachnospiraceae bacterium]